MAAASPKHQILNGTKVYWRGVRGERVRILKYCDKLKKVNYVEKETRMMSSDEYGI